MITLELRVSAVISSVTYSGLPAAPSASRSEPLLRAGPAVVVLLTISRVGGREGS
jgi:hypothetical protein